MALDVQATGGTPVCFPTRKSQKIEQLTRIDPRNFARTSEFNSTTGLEKEDPAPQANATIAAAKALDMLYIASICLEPASCGLINRLKGII